MRILVASIVRQVDEIYLPHLETIRWQDADADLDYVAFNDGISDRAIAEVVSFGGTVEATYPKPFDAYYEVREDTHVWSVPAFHWLAIQKQLILERAIEGAYDALLLIDSDLLIAPDTLRLALNFRSPVVSPVFWTRFKDTDPKPMPQVWETHPGCSSDAFVDNLRMGIPQKCAGIGAITLIHSSVFHKVGWWPLIHGLPGGVWQGEDRHFCLRTSANGIDLWADPRHRIFHCYRPSDIPNIPNVMASFRSQLGDNDHVKGQGSRARESGNAERSGDRAPPRAWADTSATANA